jgi:hypothetical protein
LTTALQRTPEKFRVPASLRATIDAAARRPCSNFFG